MAYYIKVTQQVCKKLGHGVDRNDTADENKLMWQADIDNVEGDTVFDRAANVGGVCLDAWAAKAEIDGVENPAEVFTPDAYKDPEEAQTDNAPTKEQSQQTTEQEPIVEPTKEGETV